MLLISECIYVHYMPYMAKENEAHFFRVLCDTFIPAKAACLLPKVTRVNTRDLIYDTHTQLRMTG